MMSTIDVPVFEAVVRDCLAHLDDYNFLQGHPLVQRLIPHVQANSSRVQAFQQLIFSTIDRLKPFEQGGLETKSNRLYNILNLRYQQKYQVQYVLRQLNLGERQFYRDHAKAVQVLARLLEEQAIDDLAAPVISESTLSIQAELGRIHRQNSLVLTDAELFLNKTLDAIKVLSERQQSVVTSRCIDPILPDTLDHMLIRQVIIWIASQLLMQAPLRSRFEITYSATTETTNFEFTCEPEVQPTFLESQHETLEALLNALGARLYQLSECESCVTIVLQIPFQQRSILIIDDNPDAIAIFRQLLIGQPYQIHAANDGVEAITLAQNVRPELIVLDVLLPNQDGWEILQRLKNHPMTMNIPVMICSVLDAADLAIVLGADAFILKPPQKTVFFDELERVTQNSSCQL
jgi:CheY-like chemotaxis protein